jgi:glycosyltransferase involved in cell wall biosynthesis
MADTLGRDLGQIGLLCGTRVEGTNAILDYTRLLDRALRDQGVTSAVELMDAKTPDLRPYDTVVLQYNPFLYGRWGFAPHVPASLARWRLRRGRPLVALMTHETYFPISDWRSAIMGSTQWAQLRALHALSDVVLVSIERWTRQLADWRPCRPVAHLPVGSNLPDRREARSSAREEIEADNATIVVASFGTAHPSHLADHMAAAVNTVARNHDRVVMLSLGAGGRKLPGLDRRVVVVRPGRLPATDVARLLSAGDLFLAPFDDGVSTRRGSVMAAMQHGLAIIGTHGELTDSILSESGALELVPRGDLNGFAQAAVALATDTGRRERLGACAASLYRREFDWPVIAARMCDYLSLGGRVPGRQPRTTPGSPSFNG